MSRYVYAIVRCLPEPRTGEFMNVGAIAGDPVTGDWSVRQLSAFDRVRRFAGTSAMQVATNFLLRVDAEIDRNRSDLEEGGDPLTEAWLRQMHHDHRNIVQLSPPAPILAESAEQALDLIFSQLIIDPVAERQPRPVGKHLLVSRLREAYRSAAIADYLVRPRAEVLVGERVRSIVDFAIANGTAVQLTQAWSFRRAQIDNLSTEVKAWGYALERLRSGESARVIDANDQISEISEGVDLQVVVVPPETAEQRNAFEEAQQVFSNLRADVHSLEDVQTVADRAVDLVSRLRA
ncbi:DUF3037 domain-containing protein [Planobispora takensis]|uniref:DUF3037 domain-containing protein n=1 Tax=Planobispora takensis TaxID=1367882 RepID=A0A8J3T9S8_9ACTN|nr:DUF3037 domain-containing protein [Planobispora takensis]GII03514.1 hypothetical protein Pta02_55220 [Planobispora takensis]